MAVAVAGAALVALLAAFFLLYLKVPAGWSPTTGFAPHIVPVFLRAFPYPTVTLTSGEFQAASLALVLTMWACYGTAAFLIARMDDPAERARALPVVIAVCVGAHVVLVLLPPIFSTDLYRYALFGRMITVHGLNPYDTPASALSSDPLYPFAGWRHLRSHYGALFLWISAAASWLGGGGPVGTALAFKIVVALFNLVGCWAAWRLGRETGNRDGLGTLALYGLNPALLTETAGSPHPDGVMLAVALVGLLLWWRGRPWAGFTVLVLSVAVNYVTGILALLAGFHIFFTAEPRRRVVTAAFLCGVTGAVMLVLYGPFFHEGSVVAATSDLLLRGPGGGSGRVALAPPVVALSILAALLLGALALAARGLRTQTMETTFVLVTFVVFFVLHWRMPWYFLTGVAMTAPAAPTPSNRVLRPLALVLSLLGMLLYCAMIPIPS